MMTELRNQINEFDFNRIQAVADNSVDIQSLTQALADGSFQWNAQEVLGSIFSIFFREVTTLGPLMVQMILLVLITSLVTNLQSSFGKGGAGEAAFFCCYIVLVGVAVQGFMIAAQACTGFIDNITSFVYQFIPAIMILIAASGGITSAAAFQPIILGAATGISIIIKDVLIPLLFLSVAIGLVNNISDKFKTEKIVGLIQTVIKWTLGTVLTVFIGIITLQSMVLPALDGIGSRAAKFAVSNFVPVVGKVLSDTVDMVVGCSVILKNSVGVAGVIVILVMCAGPLLNVLANIAIFRVTAAAVEPIADGRIVKCISHLGDSLTYLFIMMISMELMFLISATIAIKAGNGVIMR